MFIIEWHEEYLDTEQFDLTQFHFIHSEPDCVFATTSTQTEREL